MNVDAFVKQVMGQVERLGLNQMDEEDQIQAIGQIVKKLNEIRLEAEDILDASGHGAPPLPDEVITLLQSGDDEGCDGLVVVDRKAFLALQERVRHITGINFGSVEND